MVFSAIKLATVKSYINRSPLAGIVSVINSYEHLLSQGNIGGKVIFKDYSYLLYE
jgi:hypothetical protein